VSLQAALFETVITNPFVVKVCSHTSKYRGAIITIEKHLDRNGTLSLHTTIDGQLFHRTANDSFNSVLKDCRAQIDYWIDNLDFPIFGKSAYGEANNALPGLPAA
jgi:hypothetical protein